MGRRSRRVFITDCEGPITKNDNAAELAEAFIPGGDRFFRTISVYDDYLAEVIRRAGYKAGDTLRLILPFFKAFGLDNRTMIKFSRRNIQIIPQADCMLRDVLDVMPAYIVSTSYSHYIRAVCGAIGFPFQNTYSTAVDLDHYELPIEEKAALKELHAEILALPDIAVPATARSPEDVAPEHRKAMERLDVIFWKILPEMSIYRIVEEVNPIGGREKARAVQEIAQREKTELGDILYIGDSITDIEVFRMVRAEGGMAVSFNGNDWAVKEASFALTSHTALPMAWLALLFVNHGPHGFKDLTMSEVTGEFVQRMSEISCRVRKEVRTEKIGSLG